MVGVHWVSKIPTSFELTKCWSFFSFWHCDFFLWSPCCQKFDDICLFTFAIYFLIDVQWDHQNFLLMHMSIRPFLWRAKKINNILPPKQHPPVFGRRLSSANNIFYLFSLFLWNSNKIHWISKKFLHFVAFLIDFNQRSGAQQLILIHIIKAYSYFV